VYIILFRIELADPVGDGRQLESMNLTQNRLLVGGIAAFAAVAASAASGAPAQQRVTLQMERYYDHASRSIETRFYGVIADGAPNQYVAVLGKRCGYRYSTQIAGASTREGGAWSVVASSTLLHPTTNHFRARWNGQLSEPLIFRSPISVFVHKLGGGRFSVWLYSEMNMKRRYVELQRVAAGSWTRVRRKRLVAYRTNNIYRAVFTVRERGVTFRGFVPDATAAPCYDSNATPTFTS
jgi:hypothetical protein